MYVNTYNIWCSNMFILMTLESNGIMYLLDVYLLCCVYIVAGACLAVDVCRNLSFH